MIVEIKFNILLIFSIYGVSKSDIMAVQYVQVSLYINHKFKYLLIIRW